MTIFVQCNINHTKGAGDIWGGRTFNKGDQPCRFLTHPAPSTLSTPVERKLSRLVRLVHAIVAARTRMFLTAVTDPTTGRIDPVLEQRVLRMIAL